MLSLDFVVNINSQVVCEVLSQKINEPIIEDQIVFDIYKKCPKIWQNNFQLQSTIFSYAANKHAKGNSSLLTDNRNNHNWFAGTTPLHFICLFCENEQLQNYNQVAFYLNQVNSLGEPPFFYLDCSDAVGLIKEKITPLADINIKSETGANVLFYIKTPEILEAYLKAGADPNVQDHEETTPLIFWGFYYYFPPEEHELRKKIVSLLLQYGADKNLTQNKLNVMQLLLTLGEGDPEGLKQCCKDYYEIYELIKNWPQDN